LQSCIGCGCLSLRSCAMSNPGDAAGVGTAGAAFLPSLLRRATEGGE
jgi:MerR family redox-sensitive transcriptional activator SoxR